MYWIIHFIIQHRVISSLVLTVFLSLWMLTANPVQQQKIARTLSFTIFYPFQFTIYQAKRVKNIFWENIRLKEEITNLSIKCARLEEAAAENIRLRQLLGFDREIAYTLIPAHAVVREPSYLYRSIIINAGRKKGVALYMPVVNKAGVVGKVIQVMNNLSLVQLFRDPSERISIMLKHKGEVGIMETVDGLSFSIKYRKYVEVMEGDTVVTSGLGGIYPRGINAGIVKKVKDTDDPLFKDIIISPLVDFEHLEEVFVIKLDPQWESFRNDLDSIEFIND